MSGWKFLKVKQKLPQMPQTGRKGRKKLMFEGMFGGRFQLTLGLTVWCVSAAQRRRPHPHSDKVPAN